MQSKLDEWTEKWKVSESLKEKSIQWEKALKFANDYKEIKIPKKKGGFRTISIPSEKLKKTQREILIFLKKIFPEWYCEVQGLYRGSFIEHARYHSNSRFIFQFDLKDAFPSVNAERLRKILYQRIQAISETTLEAEYLTDLIISLTTYKGVLPQGAPTSPFLFYIFLLETGIFEKLYRINQNFKISCYVDGFVISSQKPIPGEMRGKIIKTVEGLRLKVNEKKIFYRDCRQGCPMITGLRIDGKGKVSLPKRKIRKWRGIIHRAALETDPFTKEYLRRKVEGFISSMRPIYGENLPPQIEKPYQLFQSKLNPQKGGAFF
jgi:hypothetical protein